MPARVPCQYGHESRIRSGRRRWRQVGAIYPCRSQPTFAELVKANKGIIHQTGRCVHPNSIGRAMNRGIGTCFAEVEVDTWTGDWRYIRAAYCNDAGHLMNPLLASADQNGSLVQSTSITTDGIPWDREFPGTLHYNVGYLCRTGFRQSWNHQNKPTY
ncbi:MAG: hypothetical protein DMG31_06125 [Acidobacteria bacterium]|nr:MAG: hypothetical protein DMG31_06125 [Acidobacteriota bacterium]